MQEVRAKSADRRSGSAGSCVLPTIKSIGFTNFTVAYAPAYSVGPSELLSCGLPSAAIGGGRFFTYLMTIACEATICHFLMMRTAAALVSQPAPVYGYYILGQGMICTVLPINLIAEGLRRFDTASSAAINLLNLSSALLRRSRCWRIAAALAGGRFCDSACGGVRIEPQFTSVA